MSRVSQAARRANLMAVGKEAAQEAVELAERLYADGECGSPASADTLAARRVAGRRRLMPGPLLLAMELYRGR